MVHFCGQDKGIHSRKLPDVQLGIALVLDDPVPDDHLVVRRRLGGVLDQHVDVQLFRVPGEFWPQIRVQLYVEMGLK